MPLFAGLCECSTIVLLPCWQALARSLASKEDEVQDSQERYQGLVGTLEVRQQQMAHGVAAASYMCYNLQLCCVFAVRQAQSGSLLPLVHSALTLYSPIAVSVRSCGSQWTEQCSG